jgi:hypothetical protein
MNRIAYFKRAFKIALNHVKRLHFSHANFCRQTTGTKKWLKNHRTEVDFRAVSAAAATEEVAVVTEEVEAATEVVAVAVVVAVVAVAEVGRTRKTSGRRAQS